MSETTEGRYADLALVLYALPFVVSFAYAIYLWAGVGFTSSSTLPPVVYREVTQNPYVFLLAYAGVALAAFLDFSDEAPEKRKEILYKLSGRLQAIAAVSLVVSLLAAWYSAGFDANNTVLNVLNGRYPMIFPAVLLLFSLLILPSFKSDVKSLRSLVAVLLLLASPLALYELGKRNSIAGLGGGLILLLLAAYLLVRQREDRPSQP